MVGSVSSMGVALLRDGTDANSGSFVGVLLRRAGVEDRRRSGSDLRFAGALGVDSGVAEARQDDARRKSQRRASTKRRGAIATSAFPACHDGVGRSDGSQSREDGM